LIKVFQLKLKLKEFSLFFFLIGHYLNAGHGVEKSGFGANNRVSFFT
jgi:hypothetical protein